ncbi:MAG TPA: hypothetical protein VFK06_09355 [Candidatus Angelobacter sp.]|nr:hypothetical protein [Candidatus Angelobacter sp.]
MQHNSTIGVLRPQERESKPQPSTDGSDQLVDAIRKAWFKSSQPPARTPQAKSETARPGPQRV